MNIGKAIFQLSVGYYATNAAGAGNNAGAMYTSICRAYRGVTRICSNTGTTRAFDLNSSGLKRAV